MKDQSGTIYPSKIMLVGEYGVVLGGSALSIPFKRFGARVCSTGQIPEGKEAEAEGSLQALKALLRYIRQLPAGTFHAEPDLGQFVSGMDKFWLEMNIPVGYGLGSSGAVTAAVYDLFFPEARNLALPHQKEDLAAIESFFHGKSSGVDALTCFAGTPLHFYEDGTIEKVQFNPARLPLGYRFFLLDSGHRFDTGPLVGHFLKQMEDQAFASSIRNEYLLFNRKLIDSLLGRTDTDPGLLVRVLSDFQLTHFRKMIPSNVIDSWIEGQISNDYYLKLNGSGGGFMLGITHHSGMKSLEERWNEKLIWIE